MRLSRVEAFPIRLPRHADAATGTAGLPTGLRPAASDYRWSETYPALYSVLFETALVKITTDSGLAGWGEAQAPLAPQVACTIIDCLLRPILEGTEFNGSVEEIHALWNLMYSAMRVRGQTGGFMLDAISGIDIALWDLAGKISGRPVCALLAGDAAKTEVPAYISGLPASDRVPAARRFFDAGFSRFKLYYDADPSALFDLFDALRAELGDAASIAVDALWRLTPENAVEFGKALDARHARWLECPLLPEDPLPHGELARSIRTPIALGESYRTRYELAPFFRAGAMGVVQPDLGRTGLTEGMRIARMAARHNVPLVPHVSIALGPQVAAAIHLAAAAPNCDLLEYNPKVLETANRFLTEPIALRDGRYLVPAAPGLGVEILMTGHQVSTII